MFYERIFDRSMAEISTDLSFFVLIIFFFIGISHSKALSFHDEIRAKKGMKENESVNKTRSFFWYMNHFFMFASIILPTQFNRIKDYVGISSTELQNGFSKN